MAPSVARASLARACVVLCIFAAAHAAAAQGGAGDAVTRHGGSSRPWTGWLPRGVQAKLLFPDVGGVDDCMAAVTNAGELLVGPETRAIQRKYADDCSKNGDDYRSGSGRRRYRRNGQGQQVNAAATNDIAMDSRATLQNSYWAAKLSEFAYPGTFDTDTARVVDSYSNLAKFTAIYANKLNAALAEFSKGFSITHVTRFSVSVGAPFASARWVFAFVAPSRTGVWVTFRGTDTTGITSLSLNSVISGAVNTNSQQIQLMGAPADTIVHAGFYLSLSEANLANFDEFFPSNKPSAADELKTIITSALAAVKSATGKDVPVHVTGHSLGAAQASLLALDLVNSGFKSVNLWTFGVPQIGNQAWRNHFDGVVKSHVRWWNFGDPVSQIPNTKIDVWAERNSATQFWWQTEAPHAINNVGNLLKCGVPSGTFAVCDERPTTPSPTNQQQCFADVNIDNVFEALQHQIAEYKKNLCACLLTAQNL